MSFDVRYACPQDEQALRLLWACCFPGDEKFTAYFFRTLYRSERALVASGGDGPVAMLHMLPYTFSWRGEAVPMAYLFGIGTHPTFRNLGLSKGLMEQALFELHLRKIPLCALIPERPDLFPFYEKMGFAPVFEQSSEHSFAHEDAQPASTAHIDLLNRIYEQSLVSTPHVIRDRTVWQGILDEAALYGGQVLINPAKTAYAVTDGKQIVEAFGAGTGRTTQRRPFGCLRVARAQSVAALTGLSFNLADPLAPWNNGHWSASKEDKKTDTARSDTGQTPLTPNALAACLFTEGKPPYMNLMHN